MKPSRPFIDEHGSVATWYEAEHTRNIIHQIEMMIDSDTPIIYDLVSSYMHD